jgi:hypothetical protein
VDPAGHPYRRGLVLGVAVDGRDTYLLYDVPGPVAPNIGLWITKRTAAGVFTVATACPAVTRTAGASRKGT